MAAAPPASLTPGITVVWVLAGIIISLVLPVAVKTLHKASALEALELGPKPSLGQRLALAWKNYGGNKYLAVVLAATVVAIVLVFLLGLEFTRPRDAALAGFAWESLVSKLMGGNHAPGPGRDHGRRDARPRDGLDGHDQG
jgi:hypothetical protein